MQLLRRTSTIIAKSATLTRWRTWHRWRDLVGCSSIFFSQIRVWQGERSKRDICAIRRYSKRSYRTTTSSWCGCLKSCSMRIKMTFSIAMIQITSSTLSKVQLLKVRTTSSGSWDWNRAYWYQNSRKNNNNNNKNDQLIRSCIYRPYWMKMKKEMDSTDIATSKFPWSESATTGSLWRSGRKQLFLITRTKNSYFQSSINSLLQKTWEWEEWTTSWSSR